MFNKTSQVFSLLEVSPNLWINEEFQELFNQSYFFEKLKEWETLERHFELTFSHRKHYREVKAIKIDSLEIFIKKYKAHFREALQEWKNILLLWSKGFPTSIPIFFYKNEIQVFIGTKALEGNTILAYIDNDISRVNVFVEKIVTYLALLHREKIFHQDCYLNHFYWNEKEDILYLIDVSRLVYKPFFSTYYQIKDLSQLRFSFYTYLGKKWKYWWDLFLRNYNSYLEKNLLALKKLLIYAKFYLIKRHTEKHLKMDKTKRE